MNRRTAAAWLWVAVLAAPPAAAQTPVQRLIEEARVQLDALDADSAVSLLRYAVDPRTGAGLADRLRGYTLLGIAELTREHRSEARAAFHGALALDPDLRVDSLAALASDLVSTFEAERTALARTQSLQVVAQVPADTLVPAQGGGYRVDVLPTGTARVVLTIVPDGGGPRASADSDSTFVSGLRTFDWNLRWPDGTLVEPGRYRLRVTAVDAAGRTATPLERWLVIEREAIDTQPAPAALDSTAFVPERVTVRVRRATPLLSGLGFGAAAGLLAAVGTGPSGVKDGRAFAVGGSVALVGLAASLRGAKETRPDPAAIARNRRVVLRDAQERARIARANADAQTRARVRIRLAGGEP